MVEFKDFQNASYDWWVTDLGGNASNCSEFSVGFWLYDSRFFVMDR